MTHTIILAPDKVTFFHIMEKSSAVSDCKMQNLAENRV